MQGEVKLDGEYLVRRNKLYIKFDKPMEDTNVRALWSNANEFDSYTLKKERRITYHRKFRIRKNILQIYRIDNGKLVRKVRDYDHEKGQYRRSYYLEKFD